MPSKPAKIDAFLASPFRVDWLERGLSKNVRDDLERAVAEKAANVLRAARFVKLLAERGGTEAEVKVWLDTGFDPAYVGVHHEPRLGKFYFLLMDATGRDRLGAVVFEKAPSVTGAEARAESRLIMDALVGVLAKRPDGMEAGECAVALQAAYDRKKRAE